MQALLSSMHVGAAEEGAEGAHGVGDAATLLGDLLVLRSASRFHSQESLGREAGRVPSFSAKRKLWSWQELKEG